MTNVKAMELDMDQLDMVNGGAVSTREILEKIDEVTDRMPVVRETKVVVKTVYNAGKKVVDWVKGWF